MKIHRKTGAIIAAAVFVSLLTTGIYMMAQSSAKDGKEFSIIEFFNKKPPKKQ